MSLVGQALLIVVQNMLRNRTWAEDRIFEQPIDPIDGMLREGPESGRPVTAVYFEQAAGSPVGLETQRGAQKITLKVMTYIPPMVTVVEGGVELTFDPTGAALALNVLGRQIDTALHTGNDDWVALFRVFSSGVESRKARFILIEPENGVRIPCMELEYVLNTVPEPDIGRPIFGGWAKLDLLLRAGGGEMTQVADMLKTAIEQPTGLPNWSQFQKSANLSDAAFEATGLAPMAVDDNNQAVPINGIISEPDVVVTGPTEVV